MAALDAPVLSIIVKNLFRACLFYLGAGNAVNNFTADLSRFLVNAFTLDFECLLYVGEAEVVIECGGGPDFSRFNPSMFTIASMDKVGFFGRALEVK